MEKTTKVNHAEENAGSWMGEISKALELIERAECAHKDYSSFAGAEGSSDAPMVCESCGADVDDNGEALKPLDAESIRDELRESVLSVGVRCSQFMPLGEKLEADEFEILLSTGGPALRIIGSLNRFNEPQSVRMEWQDWGTPWTFYAGYDSLNGPLLEQFAQLFYFGE